MCRAPRDAPLNPSSCRRVRRGLSGCAGDARAQGSRQASWRAAGTRCVSSPSRAGRAVFAPGASAPRRTAPGAPLGCKAQRLPSAFPERRGRLHRPASLRRRGAPHLLPCAAAVRPSVPGPQLTCPRTGTMRGPSSRVWFMSRSPRYVHAGPRVGTCGLSGPVAPPRTRRARLFVRLSARQDTQLFCILAFTYL